MIDTYREMDSELVLDSGHLVHVERGCPNRLVVRGPRGEVQLAIRFTAEGPVLSFSAAELELATVEDLRLECGRLDIVAHDGIALETPGDFAQRIGGDARVVAGGRLESVGKEVAVAAQGGRMTLDADQEIDIHGGVILLNS